MRASSTIIRLIALFRITVAFTALPTRDGKAEFNWDRIKYFLAFGDSYTFVQGTAGHANYSFIGDRTSFGFDASTLLGNKIAQNQTGTAEGGPNWVEFVTKCGLKPGQTSPLTCERQLWDFAFAGADISTTFTARHHPYTVMFVEQIEQYRTYAYPALKDIIDPSQTLVALWIGINDINDSLNLKVALPSFYNSLQQEMFGAVQYLYDLGYRFFLVMNLPPLDRTPSNQKRATPSPSPTQLSWFNDALVNHTMEFVGKNSDASVLLFDARSALSEVLDHPSRYGIVNTTDFCAGYNQPDIGTNYQAYGCPTPLNTYVWYDSGHMTSRVHEILAEAVEAKLRVWKG